MSIFSKTDYQYAVNGSIRAVFNGRGDSVGYADFNGNEYDSS